MTTLCLTCGGHEISVHVASSGNCNTALPWQKEATHKITQIWEKVFSLTRLGIIFYLHSKFGAQEHSCCSKIFRSRDNENALMTILLIYSKCHFLELLPFVIVRQNSRLMISYWWHEDNYFKFYFPAVLVDTLFHQTYLQFTLINLQYIQLPKRLVNMNSNDYHDYHDKRKQLTKSPKFEKAFSLTRLGIFYLHSKFGAQEHSSC